MIGKNQVSAIGDKAFAPSQSRIRNSEIRRKITKVVLPEGITDIGQEAFYGCSELGSLWLPDVKKLGRDALWTLSAKVLELHTTEGSDLAKRVWGKISVVYDYEKRDQ